MSNSDLTCINDHAHPCATDVVVYTALLSYVCLYSGYDLFSPLALLDVNVIRRLVYYPSFHLCCQGNSGLGLRTSYGFSEGTFHVITACHPQRYCVFSRDLRLRVRLSIGPLVGL